MGKFPDFIAVNPDLIEREVEVHPGGRAIRERKVISRRPVSEALQRPLTIESRRSRFRGPAWAVLCAQAMVLGTVAFLTVAVILATQLLNSNVVKQVLAVGKAIWP